MPVGATARETETDWLRGKLREANSSLSFWLGEAKRQERGRRLVEELLDDARRQLAAQRRELDELRGQVKELSGLPAKLEEAVAENRKLAKLLNRRNGKENPYGLGTPSSKQVNKPNSSPESRGKRGGAKAGHKGSGRKAFAKEEADRVVGIDATPPPCGCGGDWRCHSTHPHCVVNYVPARMEKVYYEKSVFQCAGCGAVAEGDTPGVLPGRMYSNKTIANMLAEHYFHGHTAGGLERRWGVGLGAFFNFGHSVGLLLRPLYERLAEQLRLCLVIHGDETPWADDGRGGYTWFFGNDLFKVFAFRHTRSSEVPIAILGLAPLPGTLVTDRYRGYVALIKIGRQYCLVHIIRDVKAAEAEFPDDPEVSKFGADLKPLLAEAIALRRVAATEGEFHKRAGELRDEIMEICGRQAKHPAVQHLQNIFREEPERLFRWAESPDIPAENNYAERNLRPLVVARKISFGSQSERGLRTREVLMTVLHTAHCRGRDPAEFLEELLDMLARDPKADISHALDLTPEACAAATT